MLSDTAADRGSEPVEAFAARLRADFRRAQEAIEQAQARQAKYANLNRRDFGFQVGDKVWLASSHLRLPEAENAKRKLQPRFYGPYEVLEVVSPVAYRLKLPKTLRIHPVIHVSHLKANVDGSKDFPDRPEYQPPPPPEVIDNEEYYTIEAIRNHRHVKGSLQFRVKWVGYAEDECSWLSAKQMQADMTHESYQELLDAYRQHTDKV